MRCRSAYDLLNPELADEWNQSGPGRFWVLAQQLVDPPVVIGVAAPLAALQSWSFSAGSARAGSTSRNGRGRLREKISPKPGMAGRPDRRDRGGSPRGAGPTGPLRHHLHGRRGFRARSASKWRKAFGANRVDTTHPVVAVLPNLGSPVRRTTRRTGSDRRPLARFRRHRRFRLGLPHRRGLRIAAITSPTAPSRPPSAAPSA